MMLLATTHLVAMGATISTVDRLPHRCHAVKKNAIVFIQENRIGLGPENIIDQGKNNS